MIDIQISAPFVHQTSVLFLLRFSTGVSSMFDSLCVTQWIVEDQSNCQGLAEDVVQKVSVDYLDILCFFNV